MNYYKRMIMLDEIKEKGIKKLKKARVLVIGAGGLGCPALRYLATAGVGTIGIIDFDIVSESNLARQTLYTYDDVGKYKAEVAASKLKDINPSIEVKYYIDKVNKENIHKYIKDYDYILDSPDNFETRYLIEEQCTLQKKTIIHGSVMKFQGHVAVFTPDTACYNCAFPEKIEEGEVPKCDDVGVFPPLTAIIGVIQASETIKLIISMGECLEGKLMCFNILDNSIKKYRLEKRNDCNICGKGKEDTTVKL